LAVGQQATKFDHASVLAPVVSQEVWAAGVTYYRSCDARIGESKNAGGSDFYDRVYTAERPELFFKATGRRVVGPGSPVRIRSDASWSVPEPELTLLINPAGTIIGYTIGNDMSSRDIEGVNPLYLPQAKIYDGSCALGPCVLLREEPLSKTTTIQMDISRQDCLPGKHYAGRTETRTEGARPVPFPRQQFSARSFPDDWRGHRSGG
jgi:2-dehydro-3-deoxy-D-arabinonate dehydratase